MEQVSDFKANKYGGGSWTRTLTAEELKILYENPYSVFVPAPKDKE